MGTRKPITKLLRSNNYDIYRQTPAGIAMFDTLDQLLKDRHITQDQALIVVSQFDVSFRKILKDITEDSQVEYDFSFIGDVKYYRLMPAFGYCEVLLTNVEMYAHFHPKTVQIYVANLDLTKNTRKGFQDSFIRRAIKNDIRGKVEELPYMVIRGKEDILMRNIDKTTLAENEIVEDRRIAHPRLSFYRLQPRKHTLEATTDEDDSNVEQVPILNRMKDSTFFTDQITLTAKQIKEKYFSQGVSVTARPKPITKFVNSFMTKPKRE